MSRPLSILLVLALFATPAIAQTQPTKPAASDAAQAIREIERDLLAAEKILNFGVYDRVIAEDYVSLVPHGKGPTKSELVKNIRAQDGQSPPYSVEMHDLRIYMLGDTAVAAFTKVYTAKENGNVAYEDNTHIFKKENGAWKLKISRASTVQKEE